MVSLYIGLFASGKDGSRVLLDHACRDHNIDNILTHDSLGKPLLPGGVEVSISHAAGAAAVVISDRPVGVDIEQIRTVRKNLPARVLSPEEYRAYQEAGESPELFFMFWTLKEAYYKYLGTGLPGFPNETEFVLENGRWTLKDSPLHFEVYQENLLICALCSEDQEARVIHP